MSPVLALSNLIRNFIVGYAQRLWPPHSLLGVPADTRRYQDHIKQEKWFFFRKLIGMWWRRNNFLVSTRMVGLLGAKIKPSRMLLIPANRWIVLQAPQAEDYLRRLGEGRSYDMGGVTLPTDEELRELYEKHKLSWNIRHKERNSYLKQIMYFVLHFKAWMHCMESGEPILVAECGVVPPVSMPEVKFKHLALLVGQADYQLVCGNTPVRREGLRIPRINGLYCYAITPDGADRFITTAVKEMLLPPLQVYMAKMIKRLSVVYRPLPMQPIDEEIRYAIARETKITPQESFWQKGSDEGNTMGGIGLGTGLHRREARPVDRR